MLNTLHHIPNSKSLFSEIARCLKPGGRFLIIDQYHGWFSNLIYKYIHHEQYTPNAIGWNFNTSGPLSGANGALLLQVLNYYIKVILNNLARIILAIVS